MTFWYCCLARIDYCNKRHLIRSQIHELFNQFHQSSFIWTKTSHWPTLGCIFTKYIHRKYLLEIVSELAIRMISTTWWLRVKYFIIGMFCVIWLDGIIFEYPKLNHYSHNGCDGVSIHRRLDCVLDRLFRRRAKKTWKLRVTGLCEFPAQMPVTRKTFSLDDVIVIRNKTFSHIDLKSAKISRNQR